MMQVDKATGNFILEEGYVMTPRMSLEDFKKQFKDKLFIRSKEAFEQEENYFHFKAIHYKELEGIDLVRVNVDFYDEELSIIEIEVNDASTQFYYGLYGEAADKLSWDHQRFMGHLLGREAAHKYYGTEGMCIDFACGGDRNPATAITITYLRKKAIKEEK